MATAKVAIRNVRVFSDSGLSSARTVVITAEGVIGGDDVDAQGAEEVDGAGGVLMPGLIDAHIHLHHAGHLAELARHGVTTGLDMGCWPASRVDGLRNHDGACDIRSAGMPATAPGSLHSQFLPLPPAALLSGPDTAQDWVDARIAEGSDYIKLIADVPGPSQETLTALAAAAHRRAKLVVAHAATLEPFHMAIEANADVITHIPCNEPLNADTISHMKTRVAVPTLVMMQAQKTQRPSLWALFNMLLRPLTVWGIVQVVRQQKSGGGSYDNARNSVKAMYEAGVPILAGSDCHEEPISPVSVKHGDSLHGELELLVDAGLSNLDALRAATSLPAKHFGLHDRGVIEAGKRADLVLLSEDPLEDIRATRKIKRVWCAGLEVDLK